jgi:hypothetical protein
MTPVYRAPMRSRGDDVDPGLAVERALLAGVCGVGGCLSEPPVTLRDAVAAVSVEHDERTARRVERFAAAPEGAYVWTRDPDGLTYLGRLTGPWRYDASAGATSADLVHVRDCRWLASPVAEPEVPQAVTRTFGRGGRNFQQIHDASVSEESQALWAAYG